MTNSAMCEWDSDVRGGRAVALGCVGGQIPEGKAAHVHVGSRGGLNAVLSNAIRRVVGGIVCVVSACAWPWISGWDWGAGWEAGRDVILSKRSLSLWNLPLVGEVMVDN
jgi:hypothetical protein